MNAAIFDRRNKSNVISIHRIAACFISTLLLIPISIVCAGQGSASIEDQSTASYDTVEYIYESGEIEIAATLFIPRGEGPFPAAVLIQGAGQSSRKNLWSRQFAEQFALRGIAAFLPDKRGTGDSGGDWKKADFSELAADIVAAVEYLSNLEKIDNGSIGVVGLSQGGFYAPIAAAGSDKVVFVISISASAMNFEQTINHEMKNTFEQSGLVGAANDEAMGVQYAAIQYTRDGIWEKYDSIRNKALKGEASGAAEEFPSGKDNWLWNWVSGVVDFDPMVHWKRISQPVYFAYGAEDEEDNVPVKNSVARINTELTQYKDITLKIYPESGHALYDPVQAREGIGVVRDDLADDLAEWIFLKINDKGND